MSVDVQSHLSHMGDVAGADGSAVDDFKTAWVLEGVQRQIIVLCEVFVDEGEARGTAIDLGVCIKTAGWVFNSALHDQMMTVNLCCWRPSHGGTGNTNNWSLAG